MSTQELTLVQEFMSEDFFTSDSKKGSFRSFAADLRHQFEEEAAEDGTVTPLSAWSAGRAALQKQLLALPQLATSPVEGQSAATLAALRRPEDLASVEAFYRALLSHLGYRTLTPAGTATGLGSEFYVRSDAAPFAPPLLVVFAAPVDDRDDLLAKDDATLLTPTLLDESGASEHTSVSRLLSARFYGDTAAEAPSGSASPAPGFALVLAGHHMLLTEQERWAEGRFIDIDLGLLLDRGDPKRGGAVERALACMSHPAIAPGPDGTTWFSEVLEASVKHTESVSEDLREAVRTSIEILANEVVDRRRALGYAPLQADQAQLLARQSLRYLYRILFLLYAEASPELQVVPTGATEYEAGYSLDRLRDLALVDVHAKADGTHLYESLQVLFRLIDAGHNEAPLAPAEDGAQSESLVFSGLSADLFSPQATSLIDGAVDAAGRPEAVGLGNAALQKVLRRLLLSKEKKGTQRGFISYAELGINQLGRVYEGLMSYSGFFAEEPLYEVAKHGDPAKGSWVVPVNRAESIADSDFVKREDPDTGQKCRARYSQGAFVFRLSGRERQRSASFYTPEVLTRFTVSQALAELLTEETTADEVLRLNVCEPALGSGAFALEAVRQLASEYLRRKQEEQGQTIDPAEYGRELQKAKAFIALHNVYGVDLNATAVELAEISLWLDTMVTGLSAPWFGLRLRRGNSLIGARRSVYSRGQVKDSQHLQVTPTQVAGVGHVRDVRVRHEDEIYQFLLPADGWGVTADSKEGRLLAPERVAELKDWRKGVRRKLTFARGNVTSREKFKQLERLQALSAQVDALWKTSERRLRIAEQETHRSIAVWGQPEPTVGSGVTRAQIEEKLADPNGAYRRLRRVMDAWCALWFWPLTVEDTVTDSLTGEATRIQPPTVDEWIDALEQLLGTPARTRETEAKDGRFRQLDLIADASWDELNELEENQLLFANAKRLDTVIEDHPWLLVTGSIADEQAFFHWELEFPSVSADGGVDLLIGNPPWVSPKFSASDIVADFLPSYKLRDMALPSSSDLFGGSGEFSREQKFVYLSAEGEVSAYLKYLSHPSIYPISGSAATDLYRSFIERSWNLISKSGVAALIHYDTHFSDDKAERLRCEAYRRLRRHWVFVNEEKLFDIGNQKVYSVNVYGEARDRVEFMHSSSLYHPLSVERSLVHSGEGPAPRLRDDEGRRDIRGHATRIQYIRHETLESWASFFGDERGAHSTRMVYVHSSSLGSVVKQIAAAPRLGDARPGVVGGWDETGDVKSGMLKKQWGRPESWQDVVLQGAQISTLNPIFSESGREMTSHRDWDSIDLEGVSDDFVPATKFKYVPPPDMRRAYSTWSVEGAQLSPRDFYLIAWRRMAANVGERTLLPAIVPKGIAQLSSSVFSVGFPDREPYELAIAAGFASSLISDFVVRAIPKSAILGGVASRLPLDMSPKLSDEIVLRVLRLNCVTSAFEELWERCWRSRFTADSWCGAYRSLANAQLQDVREAWDPKVPLRRASDRRQAALEIDVLIALSLGIKVDDLCLLYATEFPVLRSYDRGVSNSKQYWYDQNGRLVPLAVRKAWLAAQDKGLDADFAELTATNDAGNTYEYAPPFTLLDREADMRAAYAEFEQRLARHGDG